jgi:tetratricopeptide (TPR) repeat protein/tRNA A-37 threonylcarbamoyl transferase component Bud32
MPPSPVPPDLPLDLQCRLDAVCNAYESAWGGGDGPRLEDFLRDAPESVQTVALPELIQIEIHYRRKAGAALDPAEFHRRFPELDSTWLSGLVSATAVAPAYPEVPGYEIRGLLGRGGMGVVYHARDLALDRPVALKMIHPVGVITPEERLRFRFEAELAARVRHPNVVQVYEVGEHAGQHYVALEYVEGGTLAERVRQGRPVPRAAARLLATLAEAVGAAHAQGIIHRDLKPANVLLQRGEGPTPPSPDPVPKIADFGLARQLDRSDRLTATGVIVGTPAYMAPEQARAEKYLGPAVDIYALGAILYELLTGRPPFTGATGLELLARLVSEDPPPPSRLVASIPRDLEVICLKCLAREPGRRYPSAADLATDLHAFLEDRPITARPARWTERLGRWCRRHPAVAALTTALAVVVPAALVGLTLLYLDADRERQRATTNEGRANDARQEAVTNARRAQDGYRLARQAWEDGVTTVLDDPRFKSGPFEDLRRQVLRAETKFYEPFVELYKGEPAYQSERGRAYLRLAEATNQLGSKEEALYHYRAALAIFQSLTDQDRRHVEHRNFLASAHNDLGNWYLASSDLSEAEKEYRASRALWRALAGEHPERREFHSGLANSLNGLGAVCRATRRAAEAEKEWGTACDLWRELLTKEPENLKWRVRLATTQGNLGLIYHETNRRKEAETALRASRAAGRELVAKQPDRAEHQMIVARADNNLGELYQALGRPDDADKAYRAALDVMKVLVEQHPAVTEHQENLAALYGTLATLHLSRGRWQQALGPCRDNVARWEALVEKHPGIPKYRKQLAQGRMMVANVHHFAGRFGAAEQAYLEVLPDWEALAGKRPEDPDHATGLACVLYNLGRLTQGRGDTAAALELFDRAAKPLQPLVAGQPKHSEIRLHQRNAHWGRADVLTQLGRAAEALPDIERALELTDGADRPLLLGTRGVTLAKAERFSEALAAVEPLVEPPTAAGAVLYRAACVHALASAAEDGEKAEAHARRAVELLVRARRGGLFRTPAEVGSLNADEDLDPVRTRADFQKLLAEVRAGLKRGKP